MTTKRKKETSLFNTIRIVKQYRDPRFSILKWGVD